MPGPHLRVLLTDVPPPEAAAVAAALERSAIIAGALPADGLAAPPPEGCGALLLGLRSDGPAALDRVREVRRAWPDLPVVVLVPAALQHLVAPALRAGAEGSHVLDALDGAALARTLRELAEPHRPDPSLRLAPEELRLLVEGSPLPILSLDRDARVTTWNAACERLFGWSAAEVLGGSLPFVPAQKESEYRGLLERVLTEGAAGLVEVERVRRDGSPIHLRLWVAPLRDHRGDVRGVMAVCDDVSDRRRMAAALQESEASFRSLFEESLDGILLTAPDGHILAANAAACRMLGYTEAELRARGRDGVVDPADPRVAEALRERRRTGSLRRELTLLRRDGRKVEVDVSSRVFQDAEGRERTSMFLRDVTHRRRADRRARLLAEVGRILGEPLDPEERVQRLARMLVPELGQWSVVIVPDGAGRLHTAALAAVDEGREALLRELVSAYPYGEGRGGRLVEHVLQTRRSLLLSEVTDEALAAAAQDEPHLELLRRLAPETTMVVPLSGRERTLGAILVGSAEPGARFGEEDLEMAEELAGRAALVLENAQLFQRTREARERVARLQQITAAFSEALTPAQVADRALRHGTELLGASHGWIALLDEGADALELLRAVGFDGEMEERWRVLPLDDDVPLTRAVRTGEPVLLPSVGAMRDRFPRLHGPVGGVDAWAAGPMVVDGRTLGVIGMGWRASRAFTGEDRVYLLSVAQSCGQALERTRLFTSERQARSRAEAAMRAREDVLGIVAHDLRSPLGAISMCAHLLEEQGTAESGRAFVQSIARAAEQMDRLIRDLLEVTRIEGGELRVEPEPLPAASLLRDAVEALPRAPAGQRPDLRHEAPDGLPAVLADPARVQQVLTNLLGNALKFTPADGAVVARAEAHGADEVRFLVSDTGPGIEPEHVPRLFDRFYQARHARRGGTGLGLAIVKGIVEAHGGRVGVETEPGQGATFWFTLPAAGPWIRREGARGRPGAAGPQ